MSALLAIESSTVVPTVLPRVARVASPQYAPRVLSSVVFVPPPRIESVSLRMLIPDFNFGIDATIVQLRQDQGAGQIFMKAAIEANVDANITFAGRLTEDGTSFEIAEVSFQLVPTQDSARADFVASTLNAALNLSHRVHFQMPEISLDLALTAFDSPLLEVSRLLQERQMAYRLMTIELATGIDFGVLPYTLLGEEVHTISFVYHSIVDRAFIDAVRDAKVVIAATEEGLQGFHLWKESPSLEFPPEKVTKTLLGRSIFLGTQTAKITDPYIVGVDRVQEELARGDGHEVTIVIRSHTNRAQYSLPEAPRLPLNPWDTRIQSLVDLERELDSRLIERYHTLAAGSLAGLTDEERKQVTTRPQLSKPSLLAILKEKLGL
jgi:hypothetical protein